MAGSIFTKDSVASQLEDANRNYYGQRTWANIFGNIDLSGQMAQDALRNQYGSLIGESYATSKMAEANLMSSGFGQGYKESLLASNQSALEKAYDSYLQNYQSDLQAIKDTVTANRDQAKKALDTQADFTARYGNAHYDYLSALYDRYDKGESTLFDDANYAKYLNRDENGLVTGLMSSDQIHNMLYDEQGNLTRAGVDFFDQLEHDDLLMDYSFGDYLQSEDPDLYNWAVSDNPYNFAQNRAGLNINDATFREMVGQSSLDEQYTYLENQYGLDNGELNNMLNFFTVANDMIVKHVSKGEIDRGYLETIATNYATEIDKLVTELGLGERFNAELTELGYNDVNTFMQAQIAMLIEQLTDQRTFADKVIDGDFTDKRKATPSPIIDFIKPKLGEPVTLDNLFSFEGEPIVGKIVRGIGQFIFSAPTSAEIADIHERDAKVRQDAINNFNQLLSAIVNSAKVEPKN